MKRLVTLGLMPDDEWNRKKLEVLNPFELRAAGIERVLTPHELGRALFHISQRRGFLSNRKSDGNDEDTGEIKPKISELRALLKDQTPGQWLYNRQKEGQSVRFRGLDGDLYADRAMYLDEFDAIRKRQKDHHELTEENWDDLRNGNKTRGLTAFSFSES